MDLLNFAAMQQTAFTRWEKENFGYETKTTFWSDFTIADAFGEDGIRDTFKRAKKAWCNNRDYFTELCIVLNHKCGCHFDNNSALSQLYADLFYEAQGYVYENWNEEDQEYYFRITD